MRGGALPPALLFAAFGFALAFAPQRVWFWRLVVMALVAVPIGLLPIAGRWNDILFMGCWLSVVVASASVHLPGGLGPLAAMVLALNTGLWGGAVIAAAGTPLDLAKSLPAALVCIPAGWLVRTRKGVAIKVLTSWLIAVALLSATLQITTPTPGYVADHMD